MKKVRYITRLERIPELKDHERESLKEVTEKFAFRTNDYYQSLIDWVRDWNAIVDRYHLYDPCPHMIWS